MKQFLMIMVLFGLAFFVTACGDDGGGNGVSVVEGQNQDNSDSVSFGGNSDNNNGGDGNSDTSGNNSDGNDNSVATCDIEELFTLSLHGKFDYLVSDSRPYMDDCNLQREGLQEGISDDELFIPLREGDSITIDFQSRRGADTIEVEVPFDWSLNLDNGEILRDFNAGDRCTVYFNGHGDESFDQRFYGITPEDAEDLNGDQVCYIDITDVYGPDVKFVISHR